jgi:hypothetical protein
MQLSFESLVVISTLSLHASLMDFYHNTSFKSILKDDSISLTSRTHIGFCSSKEVRPWLVAKSFIHLFHIAHFTFTLALHFCLGLIHPSASTIFMCECRHGLNASGTHLAHCLFGG